MPIISEIVFVESKSARDEQLARTTHERAEEILSKAKALIHFAMYQGDRIATTEQIAEFFDVSTDVVRDNIRRHRDELESDGLKLLKGKALRDVREIFSLSSEAPQATAWTPRAALRLGMLLRDSLVAKAIRTELLNTVDESKEKSERIKELEIERDIAQANATITVSQLKLAEKTELMANLHGIPMTLALLGRGDEVVEVEKPTIEVIDDKHKVKFKGQTFPQIVEYLKKRHGVRVKNGGTIKKLLELAEKDGLIAQVPRVVLQDYIPEENLPQVYKLMTDGSRQMLIGE